MLHKVTVRALNSRCHDFTNPLESNAINLKHVDTRIDEVNLEDIRSKISNEMITNRIERHLTLD